MCQSVCYFVHQISAAKALTLDNNSFELLFNEENSAESFIKAYEDRELTGFTITNSNS